MFWFFNYALPSFFHDLFLWWGVSRDSSRWQVVLGLNTKMSKQNLCPRIQNLQAMTSPRVSFEVLTALYWRCSPSEEEYYRLSGDVLIYFPELVDCHVPHLIMCNVNAASFLTGYGVSYIIYWFKLREIRYLFATATATATATITTTTSTILTLKLTQKPKNKCINDNI